MARGTSRERSEYSRVVLLPAQLDRLASLAQQTNAAIAIFQDGSALEVNIGVEKFWIDAKGNDIDPPNPGT